MGREPVFCRTVTCGSWSRQFRDLLALGGVNFQIIGERPKPANGFDDADFGDPPERRAHFCNTK
jgi:hypothetical protein